MVCLFGRKLFKPTIFLIGLIAFTLFAMMFCYTTFFSENTEEWVGWTVFTISFLIGILIGLLLAKLSNIGLAVLAGWGGVCLGLLLYGAFLYKIHS